ncbi:hypothetical protein C7974DRAFT_409832 [Boeremia exigua]|uniref:uncharacterized protein n=1 Tax=Boeremia exigua TaxID=749465 RepID=UPI001E8DC291|nr:uncharacterized protein C7974DRAFT_409832 [Boeremia exigua]KAH6638828.1 hypothetical protein C7974DRAFT_409832 [Boeremia exigua]
MFTPFTTKSLVDGTYPFDTKKLEATIFTESVIYATKGIRTVMARIIADKLAAYTKHDKDYNCYEFADEVYCNVPLEVRVNLPNRCVEDGDKPCFPTPSFWHVLTGSAGHGKEPSPFGYLRPCKTRTEVDAVMDKYKDDIVKEFPRYGKDFSRDARVIINGYKVCSDEP